MSFANPSVGYLYGPSLLVTTDGGDSWQVQPGPQVETLSVAGGNVYRVAYDHSGCPGPCQPALQRAPIGSGDWHTLIDQLAYPDRSDSAQVVNSGSTLLLAMYGSQAGPVSAQAILYRSSDGGASWQQQTDPCSGRGSAGTNEEEDLVELTAAPGDFFAGLCSPHSGTGTFVVSSADGGRSWHTTAIAPAGQDLTLLAAASPTTIAVATGGVGGNAAFTTRLLVSTDSGAHWSTASTETQQVTPAGVPAWLGFQTSEVGRWVSGPHSVWTTLDGGRHWTQRPFE